MTKVTVPKKKHLALKESDFTVEKRDLGGYQIRFKGVKTIQSVSKHSAAHAIKTTIDQGAVDESVNSVRTRAAIWRLAGKDNGVRTVNGYLEFRKTDDTGFYEADWNMTSALNILRRSSLNGFPVLSVDVRGTDDDTQVPFFGYSNDNQDQPPLRGSVLRHFGVSVVVADCHDGEDIFGDYPILDDNGYEFARFTVSMISVVNDIELNERVGLTRLQDRVSAQSVEAGR
jgi:hypothetical protein